MTEQSILTITQLNTYIKSMFESDKLLNGIYIKGEISNFTNHYKSGHFYFTLKDEQSSIKAVMFSRYTSNMRFIPENGIKVIVQCSVSVYERDGVYQLYVYDIQPLGLGSLQLAYEQLKNKLQLEGLFDISHKKQLPAMPEKIAVITSASGAALHDIINILTRRFPIVSVKVYDVTVQGNQAATEIVSAIKLINIAKSSDIIIIARGGGSLEDLFAFNDENLARAVYASEIPVISAIGHETDFTICDFVADLRAPTPTAAAELAVPNIDDVLYRIAVLAKEINNYINLRIDNLEAKLFLIKNISLLNNPAEFINLKIQQLENLQNNINFALNDKVKNQISKLAYLSDIINSYNPVNTLLRGYSVTKFNNKTVYSIDEIKTDDIITTLLSDGEIQSKILRVKDNKNSGVI